MILNIIIVLFLAFMVYWWADQGLFSSLIHLVLTIVSALLALAVWEPVVYGLLMDFDRIVESAWGVGLLLPFGLILFALRSGFDKAVPENVHFPDMANKIGGGLGGFCSGVVTAGVLVIGLQMTGVPALLGYNAFRLDEAGQPERDMRLWVPVDTVTASLLERFGGGSFSPIGSEPLPDVHPDLAVEASFYTRSAFPESRRAVHPENIRVVEDGYYIAPSAPSRLEGQLDAAPGTDQQVVIVGAEIDLQPAERAGAADEDAIFRITRDQVALITEDGQGQTHVIYPAGYIQNGQYQPMGVEGDYAYSEASVPSTTHYWVFQVPSGQTPQFMRLKQARVELPAQPIEDAGAAGRLVTYTGPAPGSRQGDNGGATARNGSGRAQAGPRRGRPGGQEARFAEVSDQLPFTINKNDLRTAEVVDNAIQSGRGTVTGDRRNRPGQGLAVDSVYHAPSAEIVQVNLGTRDADSLLGQIFNFATRSTQAPVLVDDRGREYFAIGYGITRSAEFVFSIDPNRTIRALSQIEELGGMSGEDELILYYQVPQGITLTEFKLGNAQSQDLNLHVPRDE